MGQTTFKHTYTRLGLRSPRDDLRKDETREARKGARSTSGRARAKTHEAAETRTRMGRRMLSVRGDGHWDFMWIGVLYSTATK